MRRTTFWCTLIAIVACVPPVFAGASLGDGTSPTPPGQNLLINPNFDTGLSGWVEGNSKLVAWSPTNDADGSSHSGSVQVTARINSGGFVVMEQCVPVTAGRQYEIAAKMMGANADTGVGAAAVFFFSSADCEAGQLDGDLEAFAVQSAGQFESISGQGVAPAGAVAAAVMLAGSQSPNNDVVSVTYLDDIYFGSPSPGLCGQNSTRLCVDDQPGDQRFEVLMNYGTSQDGGRDGAGNDINTSSLGIDRGGLFWFFASNNPEALVKVINGCGTNGFYWVFISAGTNVGVDVTVGDTISGRVAIFHNPDLSAFPSIQDTAVFPCSTGFFASSRQPRSGGSVPHVTPGGLGNIVVNANFDSDLSSWQLGSGGGTWQAVDGDGSAHSGSAQITYAPGTGATCPLTQCVSVTPGLTYVFSLKISSTDAPGGIVSGDVDFFTEAGCNGLLISGHSIGVFPSQTSFPFATLSAHDNSPLNAASAKIKLCGAPSGSGGVNTSNYDDVYLGPAVQAPCVPSAVTLCIDDQPQDQRFQVRSRYASVQGGGVSGFGNAISAASLQVDRGGLFWFFEASNPEALVKVLNGCSTNQKYWVFISAGTNVAVDVTVGDTRSGNLALYHNPDLSGFPSIQDVDAFTCLNGVLRPASTKPTGPGGR
jgi:hypothetical protein